MFTQGEINITGKIGEWRTMWVVYAVADVLTRQPLHVGYCRATKLFNMADCKVDADRPVMLQMLAAVTDVAKARDLSRKHAKMMGVAAVMASQARHGMIQCVETGERYANASQAAKANGIKQPNMSAHLRGLSSVKRLKGRTYRFVVDNSNSGA